MNEVKAEIVGREGLSWNQVGRQQKKTPVDIAGLVITGIITILARIRTVFA